MSGSMQADAPRILVAFATKYGQTEKISRFLAGLLEERGFAVTVKPCRELGSTPLDGFDGVLVGSPIILEGLHRDVRRFVSGHLDELNATTAAFFQVSGAAGSSIPSEREAARAIRDRFLSEAGWSPAARASFAGAISFTKYPFWLKWVMRRISAENGGSTDTSRDHEYTDWDEVREWADDVAGRIEAGRGAASASTGRAGFAG